MGRFVRESVTDTSTNTHIYSSGYRYDDNNNVDFIGVNAGNSYSAMIYSYGTDNLPLGYTGALGTGMYTYDALNRLSSISHTFAPKRTYTYYDTAQTATTRVKNEDFADTAQGTVSYAYDSNGNITRKTTTVSGVATDVIYTYDAFNRLVIEQNEATNQTVRYKYDAWGNIAMKWVFSGASTATPAEADLIKAYDYVYSSSSLSDVTTWKDLLTEYDGEDITYDVIGNPLAYRGAAMTWKGRSLASYSKNGTTITYSYDASDIRTSKTVNGVKHNYYYVEGKLMYEDCPSYKLYYTYDANGTLSGIKKVLADGTTENYAVLCNMFGDVIGIYNSSKALVAKYTYDSWGKLLSITNASGADITSTDGIWLQNSIRYRGYVYDNETKLYYLQSRYYDPDTCRFINADDYNVLGETPTGLTGKNLFSYCDCNPVNRTDSAGEFWGIITGAVLGAVSGGISSHFAEDEIWWKGAIAGAITGALSGLLVDATVVTGGTVAFVAATFGNGFINVLNSALIDIFNGNDANISEYAVDFAIGSIFGALDYGVSYDPTKIIKGNLWERLKQSFVDIWDVDDVVKHGKTITATTGQKTAKAVGELVTDIAFSTIFDVFSDLLKMAYML